MPDGDGKALSLSQFQADSLVLRIDPGILFAVGVTYLNEFSVSSLISEDTFGTEI